MTPIDQTRVSAEDGSVRGNCFEACIASLLDISIDAVPQFNEMPPGSWHVPFFQFLRAHGFENWGTGKEPTHTLADYEGVDGYVIVSGESFRPWVKDGHAVIYYRGKLFHDPHPSRMGLKKVWSWFLIERSSEFVEQAERIVNG